MEGANGNISLPIITSAKLLNVQGKTCGGCTVEIFANSNDDGEGETFMGSGIAKTNGEFTVSISKISDPLLSCRVVAVR